MSGPARARATRRHGGFTLLEMLAVVALTTLVLTVTINFFIDLSRATTTATEEVRGERRAAAILDRVARDLEGAYLVKKPKEMDPLEHPWLFLAESGSTAPGADRLKFMTRTALQRTSGEHESDVSVVSYETRPGAEGGIEILRASASRLPDALDRTISVDGESTGAVLASGVATFAVRFLDEAGAWQNAWDSSLLADSSELPVGAEIEISMLPPEGAAADALAAGEPAPLGPFTRRVLIPVRPIDLEALLDPEAAAEAAAAGAADEDEDAEDGTSSDGSKTAKASGDSNQESDAEPSQGMTIAECLAQNPGIAQQYPQIQSLLVTMGSRPFSEVAALVPPGINLVGCQ